MGWRRYVGALVTATAVAGCQYPGRWIAPPPSSSELTRSWRELAALPEPSQELVVAVYDFPDLTGQYKFSDSVTTYSRAVSQGAAWVLVKALRDAGDGKWFRVIERRGLDHLIKERQIIREMRAAYSGGQPVQPLPPMLFAGILIEGGIIGYDSNTLTGGLGANYLGIGGSTEYRQDTVSVYANVVSTQTGEVLKTVMARKTIASVRLQGGVFKFIDFKDLLQIEAGFTTNEPMHLALQQAIEHLVRAIAIEGAEDGLWRFKDRLAGEQAIARYQADKGEGPAPELTQIYPRRAPSAAPRAPAATQAPAAPTAREPDVKPSAPPPPAGVGGSE